MRRLLLSAILIMGYCVQRASAQTQALVLQHADGSTTEVELYTKPKVTFEGDRLHVKSSVINLDYQVGDVVCFYYKGKGTGINNILQEADYEQRDEQLVFHNIKSEDNVAVYNLNGIRVPVRITFSDGNASLPLSSIPAGVYLLSGNGKTVKFMKP